MIIRYPFRDGNKYTDSTEADIYNSGTVYTYIVYTVVEGIDVRSGDGLERAV